MGLGKTFPRIRLHEWKDLVLASKQRGAVDERMGEDSTSQTPDVALAPPPYLGAQHEVKIHDGRMNAAAAFASARVAR